MKEERKNKKKKKKKNETKIGKRETREERRGETDDVTRRDVETRPRFILGLGKKTARELNYCQLHTTLLISHAIVLVKNLPRLVCVYEEENDRGQTPQS